MYQFTAMLTYGDLTSDILVTTLAFIHQVVENVMFISVCNTVEDTVMMMEGDAYYKGEACYHARYLLCLAVLSSYVMSRHIYNLQQDTKFQSTGISALIF